jgi:PAS domain S-box-containing protein
MNNDKEQQASTNHHKLEQAFIDLAKNWSLWNTPLEEALSVLTKDVAETMKASRCSIWVMTDKADALNLLDLYDLDSKQHSSGARLEESTFPAYFKALQNERVIDAVDAHTDYRTREFSGPYLTPLGIGSMLDATLWQSGETHGVLCIEQRNGPRLWSEAEKQYAFSVADLISSLLISDRIRISEKKLQESLATQNAIFDAAYYSIIYTDIEGTIQGFNAAAERMLGYSEDEVIGKVSPALIHDEAEVVERAEELSRELGEEIEPGFEAFVAIPKRFHRPDERGWTYIHKNGTRIPVTLSITSVQDEQGQLIGFLGIASDITESIVSEKRIKSSEKKLAHAQAVAHMGYWDLDLTNGQAEWSDEEYRLLGYEPGSVEANSETFMNAIHPDDRNAVTAAMQESMNPKQDGLYETEHRVLHADGTVRIVQEKGNISFDDQGNPLHMFGTTLDITDLVLSEQALTSTQKRYQTLFNASGDAILVMNEENFIECNQSTMEIFGCTRDQIVGESPVLFSPHFQPDGRVSAVKALEKIRAAYGGERQRFEWQHIRYDGTPFDADVTLTYLEIEGEPCLLANVRDISEKKKAEQALKSSEHELRERNESLSIINELSSMLQESDDIRNISSRTCEHLRSTALSPRVAFYLLSKDGDYMNLVAHAGIDQALAFAGERIAVDGSLSGKAIREKRIIISGDTCC